MSILMCQCNKLSLKGGSKNKKQGRRCMYSVILSQRKSNKYYTQCVFVALVIQHAMRMRYSRIVTGGLPGSTLFSNIIS